MRQSQQRKGFGGQRSSANPMYSPCKSQLRHAGGRKTQSDNGGNVRLQVNKRTDSDPGLHEQAQYAALNSTQYSSNRLRQDRTRSTLHTIDAAEAVLALLYRRAHNLSATRVDRNVSESAYSLSLRLSRVTTNSLPIFELRRASLPLNESCTNSPCSLY